MSPALWALCALSAAAAAEPPALTLTIDAGYVGGDVVMGGFGASAGLSVPLTDHLSAYGELGGRLFLPASAELALGVLASGQVGAWRPGLGVEVSAFMGGRVQRFTPDQLTLRDGPVLSARGVVRPLAFDAGDWTISGPALALGRAQGDGVSFNVELLQVGWRFGS
ncbi:hypothetical protein L6R49_15095 [Myxococcota bacterium]|nr:hypothetical protein [Myxococcota bacterium]